MIFFGLTLVLLSGITLGADQEKHFTNKWVAEIHGGESFVRKLAERLGYTYEGAAHPFDDHYVLSREDHPEISKRDSVHLTQELTDRDEVQWAEQQAIVKRSKRGIIPEYPAEEVQNNQYVPKEEEEQHKPYVPRQAEEDHNDLMSLLNSLMEGDETHVESSYTDSPYSSSYIDFSSKPRPYSTFGAQPKAEPSVNSYTTKSKTTETQKKVTTTTNSPYSGSYYSSYSKPTANRNASGRQNTVSSYGYSSKTTSSKPVSKASTTSTATSEKPKKSGGKQSSSASGKSQSKSSSSSYSFQSTNPTSSIYSSYTVDGSSNSDSSSLAAGATLDDFFNILFGGGISDGSTSSVPDWDSFFSDFVIDHEASKQGDVSQLGKFSTKPAPASSLNNHQGATKNIGVVSSKTSSYAGFFSDPLWAKQWYCHDYRVENTAVMDHNVVPLYKQGITGKGVTVAVVDDGVEMDHPDLKGNFVESLSYDMCQNKNGSVPDKSSLGHYNSHGTRCAGEIAMVANNSLCGVGIAYNAKIAGVKTLGTRAYDLVEARGLVHRLDVIDIYSNSWGPNDDGSTMEKIGTMVEKSLLKGVTEGRKGKGAIYTFASGNGRHTGDNCAADGFINNVHTIPITSVSQHGKVVYYSERCTAVYAGAYSGGNTNDEKVATTNVNGECTTSFSGTSAATPIATGILALTLEANPRLTYRDVMHLITMTAEVAPVANNENTWYKNGRGFWVSNDWGFGILNAENMVDVARKWKTVPAKTTCTVNVKLDSPQYFTVGESTRVKFEVDGCKGTANEVNYLEQVEVASYITYSYRGAINLVIKSPSGTRTNLLETRKNDDNRNGLNGWSIKTVHNWGEQPSGTWEIDVSAAAIDSVKAYSGYVQQFTLTLHGTKVKPSHYNNSPIRKYSAFRLPDGQTSE